ncbi:MAG: pyroglutamyl-peptidase I [Planctomycetia bacterium]|nr:pyroglutamyl-peptidase I [Planctomycetia bacterium]
MFQPTVLITAFEPFGEWRSNSSWQCLVNFTRDLPLEPKIVTRLYPVDFAAARTRLCRDLSAGYDVVLHLGQASGRATIDLEMFGLNIGGKPGDEKSNFKILEADGPPAYRSDLPLLDWATKLRQRGIPAQVSYHAGTHLCNAMLYWTHYFAERDGYTTRAAFIHVPLEPSQVVDAERSLASMPTSMTATALRCIVSEIQADASRLA